MNLTLVIPAPVIFIVKTLQEAGFEAYIVGGAVRDLILLTESHQTLADLSHHFDFDFTTNARPEDIQQLFPESYYENDFGTVGITHEQLLTQMGIAPQTSLPASTNREDRIIDLANAKKIHISLQGNNQKLTRTKTAKNYPPYEITTYRSDEVYEDFRRPKQFNWGKTIDEDLSRRDFTINAMALALIDAGNSTWRLLDPFHGIDDLHQQIIKTVADPNDRFQEDALRMLRAIRFSVQLNMKIDGHTFTAISDHASLIKRISWERIRDEFFKILASDYPAEGIELLDEVGLLTYILPELQTGKGVAQGGHHTTDVWTHSLDALRACPSQDPLVRFATLIHDIAKPQTYAEKHGTITFYNHEVVGARMAKMLGRRFRLPNDQIDRLFILVRYHMFYYQPHNTDAAIRRFMRQVGLNNIDDILDLREGDRLGSGARRTSWRLEEMKQRMIAQLNQPMDVTDLAINGHDLMAKFNLKPGPILGTILTTLLEQVLDRPELNNQDTLLKIAAELIADQTEK